MVDITQQITEARTRKDISELMDEQVEELVTSLCAALSIKPQLRPTGPDLKFIVDHLKKYSRFKAKEYILASEYALNNYFEFTTFAEPFGVKHINQLMGKYKEFAQRYVKPGQQPQTQQEKDTSHKNNLARIQNVLLIYKTYLNGTVDQVVMCEVIYVYAFKKLVEVGLVEAGFEDSYLEQANRLVASGVGKKRHEASMKGMDVLIGSIKAKESEEEIMQHKLAMMDVCARFKEEGKTVEGLEKVMTS